MQLSENRMKSCPVCPNLFQDCILVMLIC